MRDGIYRIADTVIRIVSLHSQVHDRCRDYRWEDAPELTVETTQADIDKERVLSEKQDRLEGLPVRNYTDSYLETLAVYRKMAELLMERGILLCHGSAIAVDGEAYLFTASSGTGKSTHTRLWREHFGERALMINDDKPLLRVTQDGVTVYGTPWDGKHRLSNNVCAPLKAICVLTRSEENRIVRIAVAEALPALLQQVYTPPTRAGLLQFMDLLDLLVRNVPLYRLGCNMAPEAAEVSYQGMQMM